MEAQTGTQVQRISGRGIPLKGNDMDTDQIIPARYMKVVTFDGLGEFVFQDQRFGEDGTPKEHPFNAEKYRGASILLVNRNFGCGSSREHAPQALNRAGIKAMAGESFGEIFAGNCTAMGIPVVELSSGDLRKLMEAVEARPDTEITLDLTASTITAPGITCRFTMPQAYLNSLISGTWDSTSVLLDNLQEVHAAARRLPYVQSFSAGA